MTAAAGCISLAEEALRKTLAESATFQGLVGAADATEALDSIYVDGLPAPASGDVHTLAELESLRPYAVIFTAERNGLTRIAEAGGNQLYFNQSGKLSLRLIRDCPDGYGDAPSSAANRTWRTLAGKIMDEVGELAAAANDADMLAITNIALVEGPSWPSPNLAATQGLFQQIEFTVTY